MSETAEKLSGRLQYGGEPQVTEDILAARMTPLVERPRVFDTKVAALLPLSDVNDVRFSSAKIGILIRQMLQWKPTKKKPLPPAWVAHAPPGTGKTSSSIQQVALILRDGLVDGRIVHLAPNHKLCEEIAEGYRAKGVAVEVWKGRTQESSCKRAPAARAAADAGVGADALCGDKDDHENRCPFFANCDYRQQRLRSGRDTLSAVLVAPVEYLRSGGLPKEDKLRPALFIVDEAFHEILSLQGSILRGHLMGGLEDSNGEEGEKRRVARDAIDPLDDLKASIMTHLLEDDPIPHVMRDLYGSWEAFLAVLEGIEEERKARAKARLPFGPKADDERAIAAAKREPKYLQQERNMLRVIKQRVCDEIAYDRFLAAKSRGDEDVVEPPRPSGWIRKRTSEDRITHIDFTGRLGFPFKVPLLVLDASADKNIYDGLLGGTHYVGWAGYQRPVEHIERTLIHGRSFSVSSLFGWAGQTTRDRDYAAAQEKARGELEAILASISKRESGRKILVVGTKRVVEAFENGEIGKSFVAKHKDNDLAFAYYKNLRGLDRFKFYDTVVLIGKLELDDATARRLAAAFSPRGYELLIPESDRIPREYVHLPVRMRDGTVGYVQSTIYGDPDLRCIQYQAREEEIVQAEQRLRSVRRAGHDIRSYIIGNAFPERMIFDHVYHVSDFSDDDPISQLIEDKRFHGCISRVAYQEVAGVAQQTAQEALQQRGFTRTTAPDGWNIAKVGIRGKRGAKTLIYYRDDVVLESLDHVAAHFAQIKECDPADVQVVAL